MIWIKLDADYWRNAKVAAAGLDGGVVFQELLAIGRRNGRDGVLPPRECSSAYVASLLAAVGMTQRRAEAALKACEAAELIESHKDGIRIVGWDENWKPALSEAERQRHARSRRQRDASVTPVTNGHVTERDNGHGPGGGSRHVDRVTRVTGGS